MADQKDAALRVEASCANPERHAPREGKQPMQDGNDNPRPQSADFLYSFIAHAGCPLGLQALCLEQCTPSRTFQMFTLARFLA